MALLTAQNALLHLSSEQVLNKSCEKRQLVDQAMTHGQWDKKKVLQSVVVEVQRSVNVHQFATPKCNLEPKSGSCQPAHKFQTVVAEMLGKWTQSAIVTN